MSLMARLRTLAPDLATNFQEIQGTEQHVKGHQGMKQAKPRLWETPGQLTWFF